jgi:hypothetical protein
MHFDPRDDGFNSAVVVGVQGTTRRILRRFPIEDMGEATEYALSINGYEDVLVERSRQHVNKYDHRFKPEMPFRAEHLRSVSYVLDRNGHEVAVLRGPQAYRQNLARFICSGAAQ